VIVHSDDQLSDVAQPRGVWPAFWTLGNGVWPSVSCASQSPKPPLPLLTDRRDRHNRRSTRQRTQPGDMAHQRRLFLSCGCSRESADVMLGCNLTPPVNNSFTGTTVVSSSFPPSANVFIGISKVTARVVAPYLDVVSLNGVRHHMGQPSMLKVAVSLR